MSPSQLHTWTFIFTPIIYEYERIFKHFNHKIYIYSVLYIYIYHAILYTVRVCREMKNYDIFDWKQISTHFVDFIIQIFLFLFISFLFPLISFFFFLLLFFIIIIIIHFTPTERSITESIFDMFDIIHQNFHFSCHHLFNITFSPPYSHFLQIRNYLSLCVHKVRY